jgi:hypothetical protein
MLPSERLMTVGTMATQTEFIAVVLSAFPVTDFAGPGSPLKNSIQVTLIA